MTASEVRKILLQFMAEISHTPIKNLADKLSAVLDELSEKLSKVFKDKKEIEDYLDHIIEYIDDLNRFFKKQRRGSVPYSRLFNFANKEDRIEEFLFDKGIKRLRSADSDVDMAGYDGVEGYSPINVLYCNEMYGWIYSSSKRKFFYSPAVNRIAVQNKKGEVISYVKYRKSLKGKKYIKIRDILKKVKAIKNKSEDMKAFCAYWGGK